MKQLKLSRFGWIDAREVVVCPYLKRCKTIKGRVYELYRNSQSAVEDDNMLVRMYARIWGAPTYSVAGTIKRAGRYWRHNCPDTFKRTLDRRKLDVHCEHVHRKLWSDAV